jgi:hypothetical protein
MPYVMKFVPKLTVFAQTGIIALTVQTYFCFRLYAISKKWYVAAPVMALCVFSFLGAVIEVSVATLRPPSGIV